MMSEHQSETEFLRHCLRYEDSAEHQALDQKFTQIQRDERCVRRAVWLMTVLTALAVAGFCYSAVFLEDYPQRPSQFATQFLVKVFCTAGLASTICLVAFVSLGMVYRKRLDQRREECRRLVRKFLESRLGKPITAPRRESRVGDRNRKTVQVAVGGNGSPDQTELTARG
ncbi:MAG: hypothetical protein HY298_18460 [Verrucomicrobia bacterium]|nr:hypothetical protein [Verrucomicrobiota bacterium]